MYILSKRGNMNARRMRSECLGILIALQTLSSPTSGATVDEIVNHTGYDLNQVLSCFVWLQSEHFVCSGERRSSSDDQKFHLTPRGIRELWPL